MMVVTGHHQVTSTVPPVGSAAQVSTDANTSSVVPPANTSSVVPVAGDTHVVHGCDTVAVTRQKAQQIKKKESVSTDEMRTQWGLHKPTGT